MQATAALHPHLYDICKLGLYTSITTLFDFESYNADAVPQSGSFILASNHASFLDPPLVGIDLPRRIYFLARDTLFKGPFAWLLPRIGSAPVARGSSDLKAIRRTLDLLAEQHGLVLFPEGTRSPDGQLQPAKAGVGMIACRAAVPVLPCRVFGSFEALNRKMKYPRAGQRIEVVYGQPLLPTAYDPGAAAGKARFQTAADNIMAAITALRPVKLPLPEASAQPRLSP